jgi:predicted kinase
MSVRVAHAPFGAETVFRLVTAAEQAVAALRAAWVAAQVRRDLARLSAWERADIGLEDAGMDDVEFDAMTRALASRIVA